MQSGEDRPGQGPAMPQVQMEDNEAARPQQRYFSRGGGQGLPQSPPVGSSRKNENKEKKERSSWPLGEDRNDGRPQDISRMHHEPKGSRGLLAPAQQHENENSIRHVENEQAVSRPGMAQFGGIHLDRHQG